MFGPYKLLSGAYEALIPWLALTILVAPCAVPLAHSEGGPASADRSSTTTRRRVTLTPVFRKEKQERRLIPVFLDRRAQGKSIFPQEEQWFAGSDSHDGDVSKTDPTPPWTLPVGWPDPGDRVNTELQSARVASHRLAAAEALSRTGALEESRRSFLKLARDFPESTEAPKALLLAALSREDLEGARTELRALIARYPWSEPCAAALAKIGEFSFFLGDYDETLLAYEAYLKVTPSYKAASQIQLTLALVMLRAGRYAAAKTKFEQLSSNQPALVQMPEFTAGYAEALLALGEWSRAEELYREIEGKFPNYEFTAQIMMGEGLAAELNGAIVAARTAYRAVQEGFPESTEAAMARARLNDLAIRIISP